jgi:hypothetical protein
MKKLLMPLILSLVLGYATADAALAGGPQCQMNCHKCATTCDMNAKRLTKNKGDAGLIEKLKACAKQCKEFDGGKGKNEAECKAACLSCAEACEKTGDPKLSVCAKYCRECADSCTK